MSPHLLLITFSDDNNSGNLIFALFFLFGALEMENNDCPSYACAYGVTQLLENAKNISHVAAART